MAKKDYSKDIETLERSLSCYSVKKEDLTSYHLQLLGAAYGLYLGYCEALLHTPTDPRIEDVYSFHEFVNTEAEIEPLIAELKKLNDQEEPERQKEPTREEATIPADLEALVAQYKENQADKILNADKSDSVEALVKRARQTWETRHRLELIQKNREEARLQSDKFFANNIDPKIGDRETSFRQAEYVIYKVIQAQAANLGLTLSDKEVRQAINDVSYLTTAGAVDINNLQDLNIASQLAFRNLEGKSFASPLDKIDIENPYSDDPKINNELAENYYRTSTKILSKRLHSEDLDFDDKIAAAKKDLDNIQHNLSLAIPNAKLPNTPLQDHATELESALRQVDPTLLSINPTGASVRTAAVLETTKGQSREISPEVVTLAGLGLTPEKFKAAENYAKDGKNANTPLGILYRKQPDVFDQVRFQLNNLHNSKLGQEIAAKPLSGLSASVTNTFNKLPPGAQNIAKFALNPTGTISTWVNRKIGQQIGNQLIKNTSSVLSQKLGNYLLKEGFTNGVKAFVSEATKKLALEAAKKVGITIAGEGLTATLAVALGIPTAGASLLIAAALFTVQEILRSTFNTIQKISKSIYGQEIETKDLVALGGIVAGGALVTTMTIFGGIRLVGAATKAALISAAGIIVLTLIVIGLYLGMIFLVAPILSTLVQLDSVEKVDYSQFQQQSNLPIAPGCPSQWPVAGSYRITEGPGGKASHYSPGYDQAVDIATPMGTPILSSSDGVVSFAGFSAPYLNTNIVIVDTQLPNGKTFQVVYAHLSFMKVGAGQKVNVGTVIGAGGTAGTGPHLHYEYKGIKYNECPLGGLQLAEGCAAYFVPGPNMQCVSELTGLYLYSGTGQ